ncbi:MAG TPA: hypothetical protein VE521_03365 [Nitrososphaera sp.]|jgi:hypothetical protein|nr:hypothetical protein [Nitrososphaera sp.]
MSEKQQFSPTSALSPEERQEEEEEEDDSSPKQKHLEKRPLDPKRRALLKNLVRRNTLCHHLQIYTQANVICRRISYTYEEGKISEKQAMELMIEAHEQMSHRGMPKDVVAIEMHKCLDKLEDNDKTSFAIIMANTNSSVHARGVNSKADMKDVTPGDDSSEDKYSESYWAEII